LLLVTLIASRGAIENYANQVNFIEHRMSHGDVTANARLYYYKMAINESRGDKLFIGSGLGDFGYLVFGKDARYYPHNIELEVIYEFGLIGFLLFFMPIIILGIYVINNRLQFWDYYFLCCFLFFFINSQFSGNMRPASIVFLFGGVLYYSLRSRGCTIIPKSWLTIRNKSGHLA